MMTLLLLAQDPTDRHHLAAVARVEHPGAAALFEISYTPTGVHRAYLAHQRSLADSLLDLPEVTLTEGEARSVLAMVFGPGVELVSLTPELVSS